ncbi:Polyribonucleotide nucleotidyltransferase [Candidatus Rubidus massiliensis]|nr:Polyribonucleotide nucleotidyltransferase [Candidatus Rubidus massiliensis]
MERHILKVRVGDEELTLETGRIARQANGSVLVTAGETMVFCTACAEKEANPDIDFFPLRVDYQEKFSSAGKTLSGFIKREGRPSERETLASRLIDRPLRPMFPEGYYNEVQVLAYVWSYDGINMPEPLAICGCSAALTISDIPLVKPVGAVRVGLVDGKFIVNPSQENMRKSKLDLLIAGTEDAVLMIEGYCDFLSEEQVLEAIALGHEGIKTFCQALHKWQKEIGKEKHLGTLKKTPEEALAAVKSSTADKLDQALRIKAKQQREIAIREIKDKIYQELFPEGQESQFKESDVDTAFKEVQSSLLRKMILEENLRSDGRTTTDIRNITIEQSLLPRAHGSSLFTRGETQTVAVCTLGGEHMAQRFEDLEGEGSHKFYLQYFFPPFSVGEVGKIGSPGRREIGHGKLAERAIKAALPSKEEFPYTIRLESNITESNGSSSMASVCGGCLALMDAGVPIKRPVAGIAMGLVLEDSKFAILSDILGIEDALGDMDFKVTGDHNGITAFQMDIKVEGITLDIMKVAIAQARKGISHILNKMLEVCPKYNETMSRHAPRIEQMQIPPSKIGVVIGPGGKQIRAITEETGVEITIDDNGLVSISSNNAEGLEKAKNIIHGLTAEVEVKKTYIGKIVAIKEFGLFVEVLPGKQGLCHISEFDNSRIADLNDHVKVGDSITVKVIGINEHGQIKLSRKATLS